MSEVRASRSERESNVEYHDGEEQSVCIGQWCCGCDAHPIGKPWGWNYEAWARHRQDGCKAWPEDRAVERFPRGSIEREAAEDLLYGSPPEGRPGGIASKGGPVPERSPTSLSDARSELRDALEDAIRRAYSEPLYPPRPEEDPEVVRAVAQAAILTDPTAMRQLARIQAAAWAAVEERIEETHAA